MKVNSIKEKFFYVVSVGFSIFLLFFFIANSWIGYEAKRQCRDATWKYGGDCVEALISKLEDEHEDFRARNNAIWALGQIGDSRALPILESYNTSNIPGREPLDEMLSQYELKKAINLVSGGVNITALVWKNFY